MKRTGVIKIYMFDVNNWKLVAESEAEITNDSVEKPINDTDFEVIESTMLTDQHTCSGHECFSKRTGLKCIICKNQ